jgi:hypothetical protein
VKANERVDPSAMDNEAIREASYHGHVECVALLLADVRVDPSDHCAILRASHYGHLDCVILLLANERVDPSAMDNEAIYIMVILNVLLFYGQIKGSKKEESILVLKTR